MVWTTEGTLSELPLAFFEPDSLTPMFGAGLLSNVYQAICLGHNAVSSYKRPDSLKVLEVVDLQESGMFAKHDRKELESFIEIFFPHPLRFRRIWAMQAAAALKSRVQPLHVWQAVPPNDDFVAIGMIVTTSDVEPQPGSMRCVPKWWVEQASRDEVGLLWTDAGMGGSRATFWVQKSQATPFFRVTTGADALVTPDIDFVPTAEFALDKPELPKPTESHADNLQWWY